MIRNDYLPWMGIPEGVMTQIDSRWTECSRLWYIPPVTLVSLGGGAMESRPTGVAEASIPQAAPAVPVSALVAPTPEPTPDWWSNCNGSQWSLSGRQETVMVLAYCR